MTKPQRPAPRGACQVFPIFRAAFEELTDSGRLASAKLSPGGGRTPSAPQGGPMESRAGTRSVPRNQHAPAASTSVQPTISFQIQAVHVVEFYAFFFQQASLEYVPAVARETERHFALGIDNAVPRHVRLRVEALKDPADKAGASRHARHRGDLTIGCHPTARNAANHGANRLGSRIASQRDGRARLSYRKARWLPPCRRRAFDESRGRTGAGPRPFGRRFHASFSAARAPPLRSYSRH